MLVLDALIWAVISTAYGAPATVDNDSVGAAEANNQIQESSHNAALRLSTSVTHENLDSNSTMLVRGGPTRRLLMPGPGPESHASLDMISDFIGGAQAQFGDVTSFIGKALDAVGDGFDGVLALGRLAESAANGVSNLISLLRGASTDLLVSPGMKAYSKSLERVSAAAKARHVDASKLDRLSAKLRAKIAYAERHRKLI